MTPEFETWAKENHCLTESAWKAWQAATKTEREACAAICDENEHHYNEMAKSPTFTDNGRLLHEGMRGGAHNCAADIRERSNVEVSGG